MEPVLQDSQRCSTTFQRVILNSFLPSCLFDNHTDYFEEFETDPTRGVGPPELMRDDFKWFQGSGYKWIKNMKFWLYCGLFFSKWFSLWNMHVLLPHFSKMIQMEKSEQEKSDFTCTTLDCMKCSLCEISMVLISINHDVTGERWRFKQAEKHTPATILWIKQI